MSRFTKGKWEATTEHGNINRHDKEAFKASFFMPTPHRNTYVQASSALHACANTSAAKLTA